jgi:hypothetical protein
MLKRVARSHLPRPSRPSAHATACTHIGRQAATGPPPLHPTVWPRRVSARSDVALIDGLRSKLTVTWNPTTFFLSLEAVVAEKIHRSGR